MKRTVLTFSFPLPSFAFIKVNYISNYPFISGLGRKKAYMRRSGDIIDESDLLHGLREGDEAAFNELYHRYKLQLGYRLLRLLRSETLAEELLQDLFLKIWQNRQEIDPAKSFRAYLYRIAENMVINLLKRASKEKEIHASIISSTSELYLHVEENLFRKENKNLLYEALSLLPDKRKQVFILCKLEGKSYREVADALGISVNTVNDHVQKATQFLRSHLASHPGMQLSLILAYLFAEM